jgi:hypothetical protein
LLEPPNNHGGTLYVCPRYAALHDWSVHLINTHDPLRGHVLEHVRRAAPEQPALHGGTKVIGKTEAVVSSERTACFEPGVSFAALGLEGVDCRE